jgi:hypothetical protein
MTYFIRSGREWDTFDSAPAYQEKLPVGTYLLNHASGRGYYLSEIDDFTLPAKTYGSEIDRHERIVNTFLARPATTGVILSGEKGAGKTLLAKRVSIELAQSHGIPTIVINAPHCGDAFNEFMQSIKQPVMIMLDEFEKVYSASEQASLLTVLDGTMASKKLFVVAINEANKMNSYMLNRPGRFFYVFNYAGVAEDAVREYLEDRLLDKTRIESVVTYSQFFRNFTFDMLSAIVEEMNRYNESVRDVLKYLNVNMSHGGGDTYEVIEVSFKDCDDDNLDWAAEETKGDYYARRFNDGDPYNPLQDEVRQPVYRIVRNAEDESGFSTSSERYLITPDDIVKFERGGFFHFETDVLTMKIGKRSLPDRSKVQNILD